MKTILTLEIPDYFALSQFSFSMDWPLPVFPRVGEKFNTFFLVSNIIPDEFSAKLVSDERKDWDEAVKKYITECSMDESTAKTEALKEWIGNIYLSISDIHWCRDSEGYYVEIFLEDKFHC